MADNSVVIHVKAKDDASGVFGAVDKKAQGLGSTLQNSLKMGAAAGGAALVGLGVSAIKAGVDFESAFAEVKTLLPNLTDGELKDLQNGILDFSKATGIATSQAIPALYQAISAGVPPDNVISFMETAADASIGGITSLETAVDGISSVVNAYGSEVMDATAASDMMFTAVKLGKTDFEQLSSNISKVTPTAAALGVGFEDVAASLAVLTAGGTSTAEATTQLNSLFAELGKSGTAASKTFTEIAGKSFPEFIAEGGNVNEALQLMQQHADANDLSMIDLFGSLEAAKGAMSLAKNEGAALSSALDEMTNSAGATTAAADVMRDTTEFKLQKALNTLQVTLTEIGLVALPIMMDAIEDAADWIENEAIPAIQEFYTENEATFNAIRDIVETVFPIVVEVIRIALEDILSKVEVVFATITGILDIFSALLSGDFTAAWDATKEMIGKWADFVETQITLLWEAVDAVTMGALGDFVTAITDFWNDDLKPFFENLPGNVVTALVELPGALRQAGVDALRALSGGITGVWGNELKPWLTELPGKALAALGDLFTKFGLAGRELMRGVWDGIKGLKGWLMDKVAGIASDILGAFKNPLGIFSPSKVMADEVGAPIVEGIAEGMGARQAHLLAVVKDLREQLSEAMGRAGTLSGDMLIRALTVKFEEAKNAYDNFLNEMNNKPAPEPGSGGGSSAGSGGSSGGGGGSSGGSDWNTKGGVDPYFSWSDAPLTMTPVGAVLNSTEQSILSAIMGSIANTSGTIEEAILDLNNNFSGASFMAALEMATKGKSLPSQWKQSNFLSDLRNYGLAFDSGGWLMPGLTLAMNNTGRPERVLGPQEMGGNHYYITVQAIDMEGAERAAPMIAKKIQTQLRGSGSVGMLV